MNFLSTMLSGREGSMGMSRGQNSSDSGVREDGQVTFGLSAMQGKRHNMEDYTQVRETPPQNGSHQ